MRKSLTLNKTNSNENEYSKGNKNSKDLFYKNPSNKVLRDLTNLPT